MYLKKLPMITLPDRPPPEDEVILSMYAAGHYLGCYTSSIRFWIDRGLLRGGAYHLPHRNSLVWWVSKKDLAAVKQEGNGLHQIGFKLRGLRLKQQVLEAATKKKRQKR